MTTQLNPLVAVTLAAAAKVDPNKLTQMIADSKRAGCSHFVVIPNSHLIGFGTNDPNQNAGVDDVVIPLSDW